MPQSLIERLKNKILVCDGAMGTQLQQRGLSPEDCPEEFNMTHPEIVQSIHRDYLDAGADIIETNSFGGNRARLSMYDFGDQVEKFNRRAAELAREMCPPNCFVAGSVGPTGQILQPLGLLSEENARNIFKEQVSALIAGGVDAIFIETMMSLEEILLAVQAVKMLSSLPVSATMTFEMKPTGPRTSWGVSPADAVRGLTDAGVDILGANCGSGFDDMVKIINAMRQLTDIPIIAQANAGMPILEAGSATYNESPETMRPKATTILRTGVNILGSCCGTGPEHIRVLRELADNQMS